MSLRELKAHAALAFSIRGRNWTKEPRVSPLWHPLAVLDCRFGGFGSSTCLAAALLWFMGAGSKPRARQPEKPQVARRSPGTLAKQGRNPPMTWRSIKV